MDAEQIKSHLKLSPHPEGGYYSEVYRSEEWLDFPPERFSGPRATATSIYFLLEHPQHSRFHRIRSDELWFFHTGSPLNIHRLTTDGTHRVQQIGPDCFQTWVPKGDWFAAEVNDPGGFTLVSCVVAPGFDFADFEIAKTVELLKNFPRHESIIRQLS